MNSNNWKSAALGAMGTILLVLLSFGVQSYASTSAEVTVHGTEIAILKDHDITQERMLRELLEEVKLLRREISSKPGFVLGQ